MKLDISTTRHVAVSSLILVPAVALPAWGGYVDYSVIRSIYLPTYVVVLAALLFRQYILGYFLSVSAGLGLLAEYTMHLYKEHPTMSGAFVNTVILFSGLVLGATAQLAWRVRQKRGGSPNCDADPLIHPSPR